MADTRKKHVRIAAWQGETCVVLIPRLSECELNCFKRFFFSRKEIFAGENRIRTTTTTTKVIRRRCQSSFSFLLKIWISYACPVDCNLARNPGLLPAPKMFQNQNTWGRDILRIAQWRCPNNELVFLSRLKLALLHQIIIDLQREPNVRRNFFFCFIFIFSVVVLVPVSTPSLPPFLAKCLNWIDAQRNQVKNMKISVWSTDSPPNHLFFSISTCKNAEPAASSSQIGLDFGLFCLFFLTRICYPIVIVFVSNQKVHCGDICSHLAPHPMPLWDGKSAT